MHCKTFVAALIGFLFVAGLEAQDRLTPELLWKLGRVSDLQLSPDGSTLLYHLRRYELESNGGSTQVWAIDLASGEHRQLTTAGSNFNARWSPDGSRIALLSTRAGAPQIHVLPVSGGEARQVTAHEGGVANLAWSPNGEWFSFTATVMLQPQIMSMFEDLPEAQVQVYDDLMVRHWDHWKDGSYSHLFVMPSAGGEARDLFGDERVDTPLQPFGGGEQIAWAPDSKSICYVAKRVENPEWTTNSDIYMVSLEGGEHQNLTEGMPGYEINPSFQPGGDMLAFESMARDGYESDQNRLFVLDLPTLEKRQVTDWDLSVAEYSWLRGGGGFVLCADTQGTHQVFSVPLTGGEPKPVTTGRWHFGGLVPATEVNSLFALRMQTERPFELVRVALGGEPNEGEALSDINGALLGKLKLPTVEERWFESKDGSRVHCWVTYPPDFDPSKKWPMLTYCQGGPQSQVGQWFSFRWNFHLMAAQGYVVLGINRRGLPGFGTEWNEAISQDWGGACMDDVLACTDGMFEEAFIDRERTAAIGASYGGYAVYWLMGHDQDDRFCAMIAHCGVFNLESMYLSTEELFFPNWDLGGPFWRSEEAQSLYDDNSPHRFIGNWDTPLMVIHGQQDLRVPVEQGLQAFTAAQLQGVPSRLVYFPTESHFVLGPQNGVAWHRLFYDWLDRYCK